MVFNQNKGFPEYGFWLKAIKNIRYYSKTTWHIEGRGEEDYDSIGGGKSDTVVLKPLNRKRLYFFLISFLTKLQFKNILLQKEMHKYVFS